MIDLFELQKAEAGVTRTSIIFNHEAMTAQDFESESRRSIALISAIRGREEACLNCAVRSRWKRIRYNIEWLALSAAAKFIPLLSRKACFHLAQFLGALMSVLDRHGHAWP